MKLVTLTVFLVVCTWASEGMIQVTDNLYNFRQFLKTSGSPLLCPEMPKCFMCILLYFTLLLKDIVTFEILYLQEIN